MAAADWNITIEQGGTFRFFATYKPGGVLADLTGYTASMRVAMSYDAASPVLSITEADGITLGGVDGTIDIVVADEVTADIPAGEGVWVLELISGAGERMPLLSGEASIKPKVPE